MGLLYNMANLLMHLLSLEVCSQCNVSTCILYLHADGGQLLFHFIFCNLFCGCPNILYVEMDG